MRTILNVITFVLLAVCVEGVAHAQTQDQLSLSVKSSLRSFVTSADSAFSHGVSFTAATYLSWAVRDAKTEEDFKALMVASRVLYCQKVLEDLTYSTPNYSQVKSDFESELKNDLTSLKNSTQ
jgi:hypothetical protein